MVKASTPLLRNSERQDFKRCPWYWQETWLKGRSTSRVPTWAWFGSAIHSALEVRYPPGVKRGSTADVLQAFIDAVGQNTARIWQDNPDAIIDEEEMVDAIDLGKAMLIGYIQHFGKDSEWEVIHTEQPFQIDVPHPYIKGKTIVIFAGTWDALWRNRISKKFWLVDHKTRRSFPKNWDFYNLNDQAGSYLWVAPEVLRYLGVFGKKDQIEGLIFNALKKHMPDTRPRNADGLATNKPQKAHYEAALSAAGVASPSRTTIAELYSLATAAGITVFGDVSAVQPGELFHRSEIHREPEERVKQAHRVQMEALWMEQVRKGALEAVKIITEDCVRCQLFEYCEADEMSKEDGKEIRKMLLQKRDHYADHRDNMKAKKGVSL